MSNISIKKAAFINFVGKYTNVVIQLGIGAILARILTPDDYGIVAVVSVFTTFFMLFASMGIGPAIIHNRKLFDADINHIFSFTFYIAIVISFLFALISLPISWFYNDSVYIPIGALLSLSLFFNTMNIVPNAVLLKEHKFLLVNARLVAVTVISAIPTIIMAVMGFKYYALVVHSILVSILKFIWNYYNVKPRFIFRPSLASFTKIRQFSTYQMAFSVVNYFSRNLDNLLIGKFIGSNALGYYEKSYRLMSYPIHNLTNVITPVLLPILSKHQDNKQYIYDQYLKVATFLSAVGVFITVYSYFASAEIILIMFGPQWAESVPAFQYLSLSIWFQMVTSSTSSIFQTIGNTKLLLTTGVISTILVVACIFAGISMGSIQSVAAMVTIAYSINILITFYMLIKIGFKFAFLAFLKSFLPDIIMFIFCFTGMYLFAQIIPQTSLLISGLLKFIVCSILYMISLFITGRHRTLRLLLKRKKKPDLQ